MAVYNAFNNVNYYMFMFYTNKHEQLDFDKERGIFICKSLNAGPNSCSIDIKL